MKTYKRKPKEHREIEGVLEMCRLCLEKTEGGVQIFKGAQDVCAAVAMRVGICVGLEITYEDCLPNMICTNCYKELEKYYKFRKKCEVSYQKLKSHLLALREKENRIAYVVKDEVLKEDEIKITQPTLQLGQEEVQIQQPEMQLEQSEIHVKHQLIQFNQPSMQMEQMSIQTDQPSIQIDEPSIQIDKQSIQMEQRSMLLEQPSMQLNQRSMQSGQQCTQFTQLSMQLEQPTMQMDQPSIQLGQPSLHMEQPCMQLVEVTEVNTNDDTAEEKIVEMEEVQIPIETEANHNISTFLTSILTELGILAVHGDQLTVQDSSVTSLELETGADDQYTLELVEEDDSCQMQIVAVERDIIQKDIPGGPKSITFLESQQKRTVPKGIKKHGAGGAWCVQCGRVFSSASAARRHAASHGGARPHACHLCARTFTQAAVRDRHTLVHLEVRPHACTVCSKSFTQRGALLSHARTHAASRALAIHRCLHCDKVFLYASGLSRHIKSHMGRVYECSACDKRFKDRSSLRRHLNNFCHRPVAEDS